MPSLRLRALCCAAVLGAAALAGLAAPAVGQTFTPARDQLLSSRTPTLEEAEAWAEEFLSLEPDVASFETPEPGHVVVETRAGKQVDLYLDDFVDRLSAPSATRSQVLASIEAGLSDSLASTTGPVGPTPENILPIVRNRNFLTRFGGEAGESGPDQPVSRALAGDVVALLAYDSGTGPSIMSRRSLGLNGVSNPDAFGLAVANLLRVAANVSWAESDDGLRAARLDGTYESSLLLLDDFWDDVADELSGPVAAVAPTPGSLIVGRADEPDDVTLLRYYGLNAALDADGVSTEVLVRRDGAWRVLPEEPE